MLEDSVIWMTALSDYITERKTDSEYFVVLSTLQEKFQNLPINLCDEPGRQFLREAALRKYRIWLFSDIGS